MEFGWGVVCDRALGVDRVWVERIDGQGLRPRPSEKEYEARGVDLEPTYIAGCVAAGRVWHEPIAGGPGVSIRGLREWRGRRTS